MSSPRDNLPQSWIVKSLGDVLDIQGGSQPPKAEFIYEPAEGYIQLLQIRDFGEKPVPTFVPQNRVTKFCRKDDVLIARYGASLGRIVTGLEGAYNVALAKVIVDEHLFFKRYLFYLLQTSVLQTPLKMISRSAQNGFAKHEIAHAQLPIPPLNEQKRIVAKIEELFTELDAGIASLHTAQAQLKTYRQSLLKHAFEGQLTAAWRETHAAELEPVATLLQRIRAERQTRYEDELKQWQKRGTANKRKPSPQKDLPPLTPDDLTTLPQLPSTWAWVKFDEVVSVKSNLTDPLEYVNLPHIAPDNIEKEKGQLLEYRTIGQDKVTSPKHYFYKGQIVYSKIRPYLSKLIIAPFDGLCSADMYPLETELLTKYLFYLMLSKYFVDKASNSGSRTILPKINQNELGIIPVPICSLKEQQEIIDYLEQRLSILYELEQTITTALQQAGALRQSILKKAFAGRLVPQDPPRRSGGSAARPHPHQPGELSCLFNEELVINLTGF